MSTRVVTAHLPKELAEKLDGLADKLDRPRGWLVKEAVEAYVGLAEERHRATMEALQEVDAGRVLEHEEVEAWASARKRKATVPAKRPAAKSKVRVKRAS